ncbi:hypothetical protein [Methylomonas sp. AM2-LC]|uniref:hypothetical protein n=1 Tax=Methylomonas sp. AM2-LC TaxID=3153301 RepID=UPI003264DB21
MHPDGSLYGLQHSNPVDSAIAYSGNPVDYSVNNTSGVQVSASDPLIGNRIGGVNEFGGGLALYLNGKKVGALGVFGNTSYRDHANAWQIRAALKLQPGKETVGITTYNVNAAGQLQTNLTGATVGDELILNVGADRDGDNNYWSAWSQPACPNSTALGTANNTLNCTIQINNVPDHHKHW